jgi:transposase InsO family protein
VVVARVEALALLHPSYGCNRLAALLALEGRRLSAITIQKILNTTRASGPRHRDERWLALERQNAEQMIEISPEQTAFLEKLNPCFKERHVESERPGQLLSADTSMVGTLKGIGRIYLHAVVDLRLLHAFGFLHVSKQPEAAVAVLHNDVVPFYARLDLQIGAVLTDNGREFCGTEASSLRALPGAQRHRAQEARVCSPRTNGFVERFNGTVLDEFFRPTMRSHLYQSVEALQIDLDAWLHCNHERPHLGYRNQGRRSWETVERFVSLSSARQRRLRRQLIQALASACRTAPALLQCMRPALERLSLAGRLVQAGAERDAGVDRHAGRSGAVERLDIPIMCAPGFRNGSARCGGPCCGSSSARLTMPGRRCNSGWSSASVRSGLAATSLLRSASCGASSGPRSQLRRPSISTPCSTLLT